MSHTAFTYHFVFGTYRRRSVIRQEHEKELYVFIFNLAKRHDVYVRRIGGMPDHIHILCDVPAKQSVSKLIQLLKCESSKFMRVTEHFPYWEGWAEGYGGFTVDASLREVRRQYIMHQREHHTQQDFADEYRQLLIENGFSDSESILGDAEEDESQP